MAKITTTSTAAGNTGKGNPGGGPDKKKPVVSIALVSDTGSSASDGITSNPTIKGTGEANTVVTIMEGSTVLGTTTADATGAWSFTPTGLIDGAHTLTASQTDAAGNTGTATLNFTLDKTAPALSIGWFRTPAVRRATGSPRTRRSRAPARPIPS